MTFLKKWRSVRGGGLTSETFTANVQTISAIKDFAFYLLNSVGFHYVLLGKAQSDNLEERFGWYRMKCGGNLMVSIKDVVVTEQKIKCLSLFKSINTTSTSEEQAVDFDVVN